MLNDLRFGARSLLRTPGSAALLIITLALGIGANSAIFSVVDSLLLKPLPYPHAERLYAVTLANDKPEGFQSWPYPKYAAFAQEQTQFDATAVYARTELTLTIADQPRRLEIEVVSSSYFPMLGVRPLIGRGFTAAEEAVPARDAVVVLSDALWKRALGADPHVVGRTVLLKGREYSIIGVMPPWFRGQSGGTQLWLPVMMADHFMYEGAASASYGWWLRVLARLRDGTSPESAAAQMPALTGRVAAIAPSMLKVATRNGQELFQLVPLRTIKVDPDVRRSFLILFAAVGIGVLIACANSASLLLGRAVSRESEFAVRRALGASERTIVRQVLVESLLLATVAGTAALIISVWTLHWLSAVKPMNTSGFWSQYARTFDYFAVAIDARVITFNYGIAFAAGVLVGLFPARHSSRMDLGDALKRRDLSALGSSRFSARTALVIAEIALSIVLLVSAGLMLKSFVRAAATDLGFEPEEVVAAAASIEGRKPVAFFRDLIDRIGGIPGVDDVALASGIPIGRGLSGGPVEIEGRPKGVGDVRASINVVTPGFFHTFRIRTLSGRLFDDNDRETSPRVAVVTRAFAQAAWPGQDAIGKHVRHGFRVAFGDAKAWTTVIGVVEDAVYGTLEEPREPLIYLSAWQPLGTPAAIALAPDIIALRAATGLGSAIPAVQRELRAIDNSAALYDISSMADRAANLRSRYRYSMAMMGAVAVLALLLTIIGTYAVVAQAVATRTREIGIRVALGARPRDIATLVLRDGVRLTLGGLVIGLGAAFAGSRVLASMLYGVAPHDPLIFSTIALLITVVVLLATYVPANRATVIDPVVAIRAE